MNNTKRIYNSCDRTCSLHNPINRPHKPRNSNGSWHYENKKPVTNGNKLSSGGNKSCNANNMKRRPTPNNSPSS